MKIHKICRRQIVWCMTYSYKIIRYKVISVGWLFHGWTIPGIDTKTRWNKIIYYVSVTNHFSSMLQWIIFILHTAHWLQYAPSLERMEQMQYAYGCGFIVKGWSEYYIQIGTRLTSHYRRQLFHVTCSRIDLCFAVREELFSTKL